MTGDSTTARSQRETRPFVGRGPIPLVGARLRAIPDVPSPASGLLQQRRPSSGGFTLLEVLLASTLFAVAVMVLAGAYVNVIEGMESVRTDRAFEQELRWVREQVLVEPDLKTVEKGGESATPDFGTAHWEVVVEPTDVADLFRVSMHVTMDGKDDQPKREATQQFMVLRPQWSDPIDRDKLRAETKARIEKDRRTSGTASGKEKP